MSQGNASTVSSWDRLRQLAGDQESQRIIDQVAPHIVEHALTRKTPHEVMDSLLAVEEGHCILRELEQSASMKAVKEWLFSGDFQVRGYDKDGCPVLWMTGVLRKSSNGTNKEKLLVMLWAVRWALRKRPNSLNPVFFVIDDRDRGLLDFDFELITQMGDLLPKGAFAIVEPRAVWISSSTAQKFAIDMMAKVVPKLKKVTKFVTHPNELVDIVSDIRDNAQAIKAAGFDSFRPTFELLGDYQNLLRRQGFGKMTISDWSRPSPAKMKLLLEEDVHDEFGILGNDAVERSLNNSTDFKRTDVSLVGNSRQNWPSPRTSFNISTSGRLGDVIRGQIGELSRSTHKDVWEALSPVLEESSELGTIPESDEEK